VNADVSGRNTLFNLELDPAGLLRLTWARDATITEADAEAAMERVNLLSGESRHPMLVDMATTADVSRAARAVFARPCQASRIALLGSSPVDRVFANFFLGMSKVPCPTKFFTVEREALAWLRVS
jgi:stage II sporulation SpoAA-like protein